MSLNRQEPESDNGLAGASPFTPRVPVQDLNYILLFGCTGTGKTSFANLASGSNMEVGKGVRSATKYLEPSRVFQVDDQPVILVDCPGFNDTYLTETEILRRLADFLIKAYQSKCKIVGLLYFHKITDTRVGGASFRHINMFKALCGNEGLRNTVYVTNMWSDPPTEDQLLREQELRNTDEFFGKPIAVGAQIARHCNTQESAYNIIQKLLGRGQVVTKLQRQLVDDKTPLEETDVGLIIGQDLEDDLLKQKREMDELKAEKEKALEANDQSWLRRLESQEERTRMKEQRLKNQLQALKTSKATRSDTTGPQIRVVQSKAADLQLSSFRALIEAKENELAQNTKLRDGHLDSRPLRQQEWDKRRDEETLRDIARIRGTTAGRYSHSAHQGPGLLGALGVVGGMVGALIPRRARDTSLATTNDRDHSKARSPMVSGTAVENVGASYGSSRLITGPDLRDKGLRQRQGSGGSRSRSLDGHRSTYDRREARTTIPRKSSHGHDPSTRPNWVYPPSGYES